MCVSVKGLYKSQMNFSIRFDDYKLKMNVKLYKTKSKISILCIVKIDFVICEIYKMFLVSKHSTAYPFAKFLFVNDGRNVRCAGTTARSGRRRHHWLCILNRFHWRWQFECGLFFGLQILMCATTADGTGSARMSGRRWRVGIMLGQTAVRFVALLFGGQFERFIGWFFDERSFGWRTGWTVDTALRQFAQWCRQPISTEMK